MQDLYRRIYSNPEFHQLEKQRSLLGWSLAAVVMICYFSFILIIAFAPELFAIPISKTAVITWGIPVGIFVIVLSFLLTGIYVYKANNHFDKMIAKIIEQAEKDND